MAKAHRGAEVRKMPQRGRSLCPLCKRSAIKAIYEQEIDGKKISVCKQCKAAVIHGKKTSLL